MSITKKEIAYGALKSFGKGKKFTKGDVYKTVAGKILEPTFGWIFTSFVKLCLVEEVGKGRHGAKIYKRK